MSNRNLLSPDGARRARRRRLIAVCLLLVTALVVAGCGASKSNSGGSGSGSTPAATTSAQLVTEVLDGWIPATGVQFVDGNLFNNLQNVVESTAEDRCMRARGWNVPLPVDTQAAIEADAQQFEDNTIFPNIGWISAHDLFAPTAGAGSQAGLTIDAKTAAERADYGRCIAASEKPTTTYINEIKGLSDTWWQTVMALQQSPRFDAMRRQASSCLTQHGASARGARSLNSFLAYWEPQTQKAQPSGERLAFEHRWAKIFVACDRPLITAEQRAQLADRKNFMQAHAQELTAAGNAAVHGIAQLERVADLSGSLEVKKS